MVAVLAVATGGLWWALIKRDPALVVSAADATVPTSSIVPQPTVPPTVMTLPPPDIGRRAIPEPGPAVGLKLANGRPYRPAIEFRSSIEIPDELVFVLALGSDARPKEDVLRTRADSIHIIAINPVTKQGTVVGIPRDSYVQYPNGRRGKINDALAMGGPSYVADTVRRLSGLPIHYVVTVGFVGFQAMIDDLGGVDLYVDRRMNDRMSGARFEPGWHHFVGGEALAYSRNRHDVPYGDFSRSENQGALLLAGLSKLRSEVADDPTLLQWVEVLRRRNTVDIPVNLLPGLAALARRVDPERIANVVLPGRVGYAGKASVVYLTEDAPRLFDDLRADAVIGEAEKPAPADTTTSTTTTTTSAPRPPTTSTTQPPVTTTSTVRPAVSVPSPGDD